MSTGQVGVQDAAGSDSVSKPRGARLGSTVIFVQDLEVSTTFYVMTYPGPDEVARHQIMSRIYAW